VCTVRLFVPFGPPKRRKSLRERYSAVTARTQVAPEDGVVLGALRKSVARRRRPGQAEDLLATRLDLQQSKITAHFPEGALSRPASPDGSRLQP
jgi:hypothetical protein